MDKYRDNKLVFLQIPKTAGTTIHAVLSKQFKQEEICPERFDAVRSIPEVELDQHRYFSGHYSKYGVDHIPGPKIVFTFLRNPKERILSLYYFWKSHKSEFIEKNNLGGARIAKRLSLLEFLSCRTNGVERNIDNVLTRTLLGRIGKMENSGFRFESGSFCVETAYINLERLYFVGFQESLEEDLNRLLSRLAIDTMRKFPRHRSSDRFGDAPNLEEVEREVVTPEIEAELDRLTRFDRQIYERALANRFHIGCPYPM